MVAASSAARVSGISLVVVTAGGRVGPVGQAGQVAALDHFSIDGEPVMSPCTPDGRPLCTVCGRTTAASLLRRRSVPVSDGDRLRTRCQDRPEWAGARLRQAPAEQDRV